MNRNPAHVPLTRPLERKRAGDARERREERDGRCRISACELQEHDAHFGPMNSVKAR